MADLALALPALTLTCPWAHAIAHWSKRTENREWMPPRELLGRRLAIHAGKSPFRQNKRGEWSIPAAADAELRAALDFIEEDCGVRFPWAVTQDWREWLHARSSAVLCVVTVAGVANFETRKITHMMPGADKAALVKAARSPWFVGSLGWILTDVVVLPEPVPCPGAQRLWCLPPDADARVRELERAARAA